ncbi:hypothetical protein BGZ76_005467 [Entomortierella beljakovae]|nr:hypothetical protein BGZ76_005467 [Entomortierella beljakovae]
MRAGELSKVIAKEWREAPHEVREHYIKRAKIEAVEHAKAFPNYRFTPVKRDGTKRGERAARQVRDALGYIPGSSLDFSSAMILGSHMKQEAPGFVRISHSLPYCTQRKKASQKSKKSSKSAKIKSDVFSLDSSLSVLSSSKNSKVTHPFYTQTKAVTAPQNLLFLSSHSQAPVFHFIPSTPAKFPSSVSTGASSLVSFSNACYIGNRLSEIHLFRFALSDPKVRTDISRASSLACQLRNSAPLTGDV